MILTKSTSALCGFKFKVNAATFPVSPVFKVTLGCHQLDAAAVRATYHLSPDERGFPSCACLTPFVHCLAWGRQPVALCALVCVCVCWGGAVRGRLSH